MSWLYGAGCPSKKVACLVGQPWKMINFICNKISDCMKRNQPAFIIPSQLGKHATLLPWNANPGGTGCLKGYNVVLGLHTFMNFPEKR